MFKNKALIAPLGLVGITILSGAFLISSNSSATDNTDIVDNVSIEVPISCSMEGTGMTSHNANIVNGTYQADIGSTTLKVFCNDDDGFAIYAIGYTNEEYGNTNLIGTSTGQTIVTGTATSTGNPDVSNWAMKLATVSSPTPAYPITIDNSFSSYHIVPSPYAKVAHRDSGTDVGNNATGAELTTTYAAYMSKTQAADTYSGKVKYTLVHPSSEVPLQPQPARAGYIVYHPNGSSVVGEMGDQSASNNTSVTLWASNFKRDGYGFAGWNDKFDYSGTFYGPNETITAPADVETNGLSLYAVWIKPAGTIQNWVGCSDLTSGATTALTDSRDDSTYAVAKLADGKCWMIENLRLDDSATLSSDNTHNPSLPLTNDYELGSTSNHLSPTTNPIQTAWCNSSSDDCINQSKLATNNTVFFIDNTASNYDTSSNVYSYGNYYNWYSATAGHGKYGYYYGSNYKAPGDICPIGWHLPTGKNATGEYGMLDIALGYQGRSETGNAGKRQSNKWRSFPNNFIYSGNVMQDWFSQRGSNALYWSPLGYDTRNVCVMSLSSSSVSPGTVVNGYKATGYSIRCIADY